MVNNINPHYPPIDFQSIPQFNHYPKDTPKDFKTNFLLVTSKNANAMTGEEGVRDIDEIFNRLSKKISIENPRMSSTGVIGYRLNIDKITSSFDKFDFSAKNSTNLAEAIMTTDSSFQKELAFEVKLEDGSSFNIAGVL